jgi:hypothetical protein
VLLAGGCVLSTTETEPRTVTCAIEGCPDGQTCVEDACVPVAGAPDAAPSDAAPIEEAAVADAAQVALQSCDEQFGVAAGYVLCAEDITTCTFFAQTAGGTCADECALHATECVGGYDSNAEAPCTVVTEDGCQVTHSTQTCICARAAGGVGGGLPTVK